MVSTIKANFQSNEQISVKPYFFSIDLKYNLTDTLPYLEFEDLKDLGNASIKELVLHECSSSIEVAKLLSNKNIKKIVLRGLLRGVTVKWLLFISKLLRKNDSVKEIEFCFNSSNYEFKNFKKLAYSDLLNSASSRLVKIIKEPIHKDHSEINILSKNNLNKKDISYEYDDSLSENVIKYLLTSKKHINELIIGDKPIIAVNSELFDQIIKSEAKAEINTLYLSTKLTKEYAFFFINNAYLFKIQTIKICSLYYYDEEIFNHILELSNNPHNTVKRIFIFSYYLNYPRIISDLLNSNKYNIQKIPNIFVEDYKKLKLDVKNNNTYKIKILYNSKSNFSNKTFNLPIKYNSFDKDIYTELLYILFNRPKILSCLHITYDDKLDINKSNWITEGAESQINQMKEIFNEFKISNISTQNEEIESLSFSIDYEYPKLIILQFFILEILIEMNISIKNLVLKQCSVMELATFLNKHKALQSINIRDINLTIVKEDLEEICKLTQYSHLIKGKIYLRYDDKEKASREDYFNLHSKLATTTNFIALSKNIFNLKVKERYDIKDEIVITNFIHDIENSYNKTGKCNILYNQIKSFEIESQELNLELMLELFSAIKMYHCSIMNLHFARMNEKTPLIDLKKLLSVYLETIIYNKFRDKKVNYCLRKITMKSNRISRKNKRYFNLHHIEAIKYQ